MRILLTGASGFVGSHVLHHILATTDADVVCPVTFRHKGSPARIAQVLEQIPDAWSRVKVIRLDLTSPIDAVTDDDIGPIDWVLNVASESHVDRSIEEPAAFIQNNVALITSLLDWARKRQDGRGAHPGPEVIVQVSTDEVYGPAHPGYAHREWVDLHRPSNPYSASKAAQENIAFAYWRTYDLPIVLTNTMNIIGEMQDPEKFVPKTIRASVTGDPMPIHTDESGNAGSRFYLHARNQADGLLFVARWVSKAVREQRIAKNAAGQVVVDETYNVGPGGGKIPGTESLRYSDGGQEPFRFHIVGEQEIDNLTMARRIAEVAERPLNVVNEHFHKSRPGHDLRYALDGERLRSLGWEPPVPFAESLEKTVQWTLDNPKWLSL